MNVGSANVWMPPNLLAALFLGLILSGGEGVHIRELRVPDVILNGTDQSVVLDCDYMLDTPARASGLVVKWFFNNHPAPVYQWVFNNKPQALGVLKGKVNLNYRASNEESYMYRAIEIVTPTTELSGEYKCMVFTFDKEVSRSKKMIVYVPEKSLEVMTEKPKDDRVTISCSASGVFPEPNMTILALESAHSGHNEVTTKKQNNSSLYDIKGSLTMEDADLESPTTFMCELSIPDANYSNRKKLVYFPGPPTTPSVLADLHEHHQSASSNMLSSSLMPLTILFLIVADSWTNL